MKESAVVCKRARDLLLRLQSTCGTGWVAACMLCPKERWLVLFS